jgi:hypothetical protein
MQLVGLLIGHRHQSLTNYRQLVAFALQIEDVPV